METQGHIDPETLSAFLGGLPDLLESLRAEGYGLGTRQHVAAHELVGSLFAHGCLPATLAELDAWLAPLVCFTPAQQESFRERYLQWLVERRFVNPDDVRPDPRPVVPPTPPPPPPPPPVWERIVRLVSANRRPLVAAGVALAAAALFAAYYIGTAYRKGEDLTQVVVNDPPVPAPTPVPVPPDNPLPPTTTTATTNSTPDVGLAWDADKPEGGKAETADLFKPYPSRPPPPPGFWARNFGTLVALTILVVPPFAGLGLWHFLRRRRRRREAERWRGERPRYDKIKVRGARERVFQSAALRPVARGLRHYLSVESRQLDARSTVLASVVRGGLFTPVYGRRRTLPEYLVLIDRVGFGDQLAQFNSDLVARLGERDVYIDTYYFHGDPRRCREGGPDSPQLSLSDLAARHPDHYLLVFSDGTGLLSTTTGRPEPFVEQLLYWRGRALLTPIPRLEWEYREWALEREGLKVLPATLDGLRLLVDVVNAGARSARAPDFDETPPYPDILREQPALWKERDAPPPHQTRRLVTHLRRYLGPKGFELLCACAVYPVMQWGVTLFLAYELLGRREVDELLPRLLRLPWFRNGTMPQWLRRTLVKELPRARRRLVRERLEHLLLAFLEDPERGLRPRFAEEQAAQEAASSSFVTRARERLAAWRRSRRLRRKLEHAPARSPLAEPVFLNYITNNQNAEALPAAVRDRLFPRGVAAFGLRLAPAAALAAVAVLTGLSLLLLERPDPDIPPLSPPADLCPFFCPRPSEQTTDPDFTYTPTTGQPGRSYKLMIRGVDPGKYDFTQMNLSAGGAAPLLTFDARHDGARTLYTTLNIAPDAPPGTTDLFLYEGDKLRARLPFTITAAGQITPPRQQCPNIVLQTSGGTADASQNTVRVRVAVVSPAAAAALTYFWSSRFLLIDGQGTRAVNVQGVFYAEGVQPLSVRVGGLPAGCPNTATINPLEAADETHNPATADFKVSVAPQTVTVCPDNPKLNDPPDSLVNVTVNTTMQVDVLVSDGKTSARGNSRAGYSLYAWDMSGLSPGTYTITARRAADIATQAAVPPPVTRSVTVKGCPGSAAASGGQQGPPPGGTGQLTISFDDQGKPLNLSGADITVRLVQRDSHAPAGAPRDISVRTFRASSAAPVFELSYDGVTYGNYNVVVSSKQYYDTTFPITVGRPSVAYTGLKLKLRPAGR